MNRFPALMRSIGKLNIIGDDLLRTHQAMVNHKPHWDMEALEKCQKHRVNEFERTMEHAINDWNREDLHKYWTGYP
jgi:hypothetical protein